MKNSRQTSYFSLKNRRLIYVFSRVWYAKIPNFALFFDIWAILSSFWARDNNLELIIYTLAKTYRRYNEQLIGVSDISIQSVSLTEQLTFGLLFVQNGNQMFAFICASVGVLCQPLLCLGDCLWFSICVGSKILGFGARRSVPRIKGSPAFRCIFFAQGAKKYAASIRAV